MLIFTGDLDDVCPITLTPVRDLKWVVAFCADTDHAYECTALVRWLSKRWRNPLTNKAVSRRGSSVWSNTVHEIVQPLDICTDTHAAEEYIRCHLGEDTSFRFAIPRNPHDSPDVRPFYLIKQGVWCHVAVGYLLLTACACRMGIRPVDVLFLHQFHLTFPRRQSAPVHAVRSQRDL